MLLNKYLNGKVIWITGASGGLGRELAIELARYRVKLVLSARDDLELRETKKLAKLSDDSCLIIPLDLTQLKQDQIAMIEDRILLKFQSLDILIHNASLSQRSLAHKTLEAVERVIMETDFFGPIKITKGVLPSLLKSSTPQLVLISSLCGKFGVPLRSTYSAAKHALHGYFESMHIELQEKLNVQFFVLGGIKTDSSKHALNADGSHNKRLDIWHNHLMPAEQCAKQIVSKLPRKKGEFIIGGIEKFSLFLNRFFPYLHNKILSRFSAKEKESLHIH
jgi:dehydrogenase/reductase SDR family protein 7B